MTDIAALSKTLSTVVDSVNTVVKIIGDKKIDFTDIPLALALFRDLNDLIKTDFAKVKEEFLDLSSDEIQALLDQIGKQVDLPFPEQTRIVKTVILELASLSSNVKSLIGNVKNIKSAV